MISLLNQLFFLLCIPVRAIFQLLNPVPEVCVLFYHSISDDASDPYAITPKLFARQMRRIKELSQVVSLSQVVEYARGTRMFSGSVVAVTFDDGYLDFLTNALPILEQEGIPATIFIPLKPLEAEMGNGHAFLSTEQIRNLAQNPLVEIGSHAVTHRKLTGLSAEEISDELQTSKRTLEEWTERPCRYLAYPKGARNDAVRAVAESVGYEAAFGVKQGIVRPERSRYDIKRIIVQPHLTPFEFRWRLTRIIDWMTTARARWFRYVR